MADIIYFKGIRTFEARTGAPDFVLGTGVISIDEFREWLDSQREHYTQYNGVDQLRFNVNKTKDGRVAFIVDTWRKDAEATNTNTTAATPAPAPEAESMPEPGDLPF